MSSSRYARQEALDKIGKAGQRKIRKASVVIVGCGALGSSSADLLARAGVEELVLVDRDVVDLVNIHRQRYYERDIGAPKVEALARHLRDVNSEVWITPMHVSFDARNAEEIVKKGDLVLDGCDNMETRFLINDAAFKCSVPWVYSGAVGVEGLCALFVPPSPCFRCLFPSPPPPGSLDTCARVGILNTLPASIATKEVTLALQYILGERRRGELISFDAWNLSITKVPFRQRKGCECCAMKRYDFLGHGRGNEPPARPGRKGR
jgi:adenylyltransferase/sulfurtransferase